MKWKQVFYSSKILKGHIKKYRKNLKKVSLLPNYNLFQGDKGCKVIRKYGWIGDTGCN